MVSSMSDVVTLLVQASSVFSKLTTPHRPWTGTFDTCDVPPIVTQTNIGMAELTTIKILKMSLFLAIRTKFMFLFVCPLSLVIINETPFFVPS